MKGKILALFLGFAVALSLVASAQRTGGFPSRPTFQKVTIRHTQANPLTINRVSGTDNIIAAFQRGGVSDGFVGAAGVANGITPNTAVGDMVLRGQAGSVWITSDAGVSNSARFSTASTDFFSGIVEVENNSPFISLRDTSQAVNTRVSLVQYSGAQFFVRYCTDDLSSCGPVIDATRTGGTNVAPTLNLTATAVTANGSTIWTAGNDGAGSGLDADTLDGISSAGFAQQTAGTFTASFDNACTITPTITYDYVRVGDVVTIYPVSQTGFVCTSDSTQFATTLADVPAAIRPNSAVAGPIGDAFTNNGANVWAEVNITSAGNIAFHLCGTFGTATCNVTGWTASGNKGAELFRPITYMLGNP